MSLETCKIDKDTIDPVVERQTSSLKCRINPPETIPEEEIERIRRESLVPRVGLLAGTGRRKSSVGMDPNSIANSFIKAAQRKNSNPSATPKPTTATITNDGVVSSLELKKHDCLDRKDEGLGESFDRNSEFSDTNSRTGVSMNIVELHTIGHRSPMKRLQSGTDSVSHSSKLNGVKDREEDEFDGLTFTAPPFADEVGSNSGLDPLAFLSEEQAKRVTFM